MFLVKFCCANSRDDAQAKDAPKREADERILKSKNTLLLYKNFEHSLKMKRQDLNELSQLLFDITENKMIPKKQL